MEPHNVFESTPGYFIRPNLLYNPTAPTNHPGVPVSSDPSVEVASRVKIVEGNENSNEHDIVHASNAENLSLFARIVPLNSTAKQAFHELVTLQRQGKLSKYHEGNMKIKGDKASIHKKKEEGDDDDDDDDDEDEDEDEDEDDDDDEEEDEDEDEDETSDDPDSDADTSNRAIKAPLSRGYFVLSLGKPPQFTKGLGYRFGKGTERGGYANKGVDVLLTPPGFPTKSVASTHVLVQINPESGIWMIGGGTTNASVRMGPSDGNFRFPEKRVLSRSKCHFGVGNLEYSFEFTVPDEKLDAYVNARNEYLKTHFNVPPPHPKLSPIPRPPFKQEWYLDFHSKVGSGGYGMVSAGVDHGTGQPLAIKEMQIKDHHSRNQIIGEINVARIFSGMKGLINVRDSICEHGKPEPCGEIPETVLLVQPLARTDFEGQDFPKLNVIVQLKLFRDTLEGVESLHNAGYMHRDITTKNLVTLSLLPPKAAIIDFGAVTSQFTAVDIRAPNEALPPEVTGSKFYSKSVDIFGLGLAWYRCLKISPYPHYLRLDEEGCWAMISWLGSLTEFPLSGPELQNLFKLIIRMVQYDPDDRIDATSALNHPCWQPVREAYDDDHARPVDENDTGEGSSGKRARL